MQCDTRPDLMSNYDSGMFSGTDNDNQQSSDETQSRAVRKWTLGDHTARPEVDADALKADAKRAAGIDDDLAAIFEEAAEYAESASIGDFECPVCGLSHGHGDKKHDIREAGGLSVREDFAERMQFQPNCHCGVNELAMLMDFYAYLAVPVFADADRFDPFTALPPNRQQKALDELAESTGERATHEQVRGALIVAGIEQPSDEMVDSLKALYERITDARSAAGGADIADVTENRIETLRSDLKAQLGIEDADDADDT